MMAVHQRLPGICSFEQDLIDNSAINWHYIIRNKEKGEYLWLYTEEILDDIPIDWKKVNLKLAHPIGDWASSEIYNVKISDESVIIKGTFKGPNAIYPFLLDCSKGKGDVIYSGIFALGTRSSFVEILRKDCSETVLFESFPYGDPAMKNGVCVLHQEEFYSFVSWINPSNGGTLKLESKRRDGHKSMIDAYVSSCKKIRKHDSITNKSSTLDKSDAQANIAKGATNSDSTLSTPSSATETVIAQRSSASPTDHTRLHRLLRRKEQVEEELKPILDEISSLSIPNK